MYDWVKEVNLGEAKTKPVVSPRSRFIEGIETQVAMLEQGENYKPKGKNKPRRWYSQMRDGSYQCDIRYGAQSILPDGKAILADNAADLAVQLKKIRDDAKEGKLDDAIQPAVDKYNRIAKGRKPRKAAARPAASPAKKAG